MGFIFRLRNWRPISTYLYICILRAFVFLDIQIEEEEEEERERERGNCSLRLSLVEQCEWRHESTAWQKREKIALEKAVWMVVLQINVTFLNKKRVLKVF